MNLYKTTIVVWSKRPTHDLDPQEILDQVDGGTMYCTLTECRLVRDAQDHPLADPGMSTFFEMQELHSEENSLWKDDDDGPDSEFWSQTWDYDEE